ncbi:MAG: MerR family transcriptional regulator [Dethiobacteria bacterium]
MAGTKNYYNTQSVVNITSVTERQLRHWIETGLIVPAYVEEKGHKKKYYFDFLNLVQIRTVVALRQRALSLQKIRKAIEVLEKNFKVEEPLLDLTLFTDGETVFVLDKDPKVILDVLRRGQTVFAVAIDDLVEDLVKRANVSLKEIQKREKLVEQEEKQAV